MHKVLNTIFSAKMVEVLEPSSGPSLLANVNLGHSTSNSICHEDPSTSEQNFIIIREYLSSEFASLSGLE